MDPHHPHRPGMLYLTTHIFTILTTPTILIIVTITTIVTTITILTTHHQIISLNGLATEGIFRIPADFDEVTLTIIAVWIDMK